MRIFPPCFAGSVAGPQVNHRIHPFAPTGRQSLKWRDFTLSPIPLARSWRNLAALPFMNGEIIAARFFRQGAGVRYALTTGLLISLALTLVACGSGSSLSLQTVDGAWNFELTSSALGGASYTGSVILAQSGSKVTGTMTLTNAPCATSAPLTGTVSGSDVSFQVTEGGQVVTLNGAINSVFSSMSGSYTAAPGGCLNGDHGSWAASG